MSGGLPTFAAGPGGPAPGSSGPLQLRIRPQGSVAPLGGGGGALPGDGSYGDPIQGFRQINQQMAATQRTLTAMSTVSNGINAGFEAANAARTAGQRAQLAAGFEAAQAHREAMFAAPPVTGPMLPPNFAETARVPETPAPGAIPAAEPKAAQLALEAQPPPEPAPAPPAAEPSWLERGRAGVAGAASAAAGVIRQFDQDHGNVLTRGAGLLQAVGGVGEAVFGGGLAGLGGVASATGVGAAPGVPAMVGGSLLFANGLDNAQAGLRTAVTGRFQDTLAAEAAGGLAQVAGASPDQAEATRLGVNLASGAVSFGGGLAAGVRATGGRAAIGETQTATAQSGVSRQQPDELLDAATITQGTGVGSKTINKIIPTWKGTGPLPGTFGVNADVISTKGLQNYFPRNGGVEYIFDPSTSTLIVGNGKYFHSPLAASINADTNSVVGGIFRRSATGEMITNEFSGHFWQNWTPEVRQQFKQMMQSWNFNHIHREGMQ